MNEDDHDTGDAAFPSPHDEYEMGMTLLDWFAGHVLQGVMTRRGDIVDGDALAREVYRLADAMVREKRRRDAAFLEAHEAVCDECKQQLHGDDRPF